MVFQFGHFIIHFKMMENMSDLPLYHKGSEVGNGIQKGPYTAYDEKTGKFRE